MSEDKSDKHNGERVLAATASAPASRLTTRHVIVAGLIIGFAQALTIAAVLTMALWVNNLASDRSEVNKDQIDRNTAVLALLRRVDSPTTDELDARLARAFRRCSQSPPCRALFKETARLSGVGNVRRTR